LEKIDRQISQIEGELLSNELVIQDYRKMLDEMVQRGQTQLSDYVKGAVGLQNQKAVENWICREEGEDERESATYRWEI
jgi:hypothetical protein